MGVSRRRFLAAGGLAGVVCVARVPRAQATPQALRAAVQAITGGAPVRAGRVRLDVPPLIDNGNTVPLSVEVDSPMREDAYVRAIHVLTEKNPLPGVASFHLGPRAGRARVATRVRLADTQAVLALAQLSDGSFWSHQVDVVVTLAACLEPA